MKIEDIIEHELTTWLKYGEDNAVKRLYRTIIFTYVKVLYKYLPVLVKYMHKMEKNNDVK